MKQMHIIIEGRVQAVFFRSHIQTEAEKLGITGWVENTDMGKVEVIAQGPEDKLEKLLTFCRKGPEAAHVENCTFSYEPIEKKFQHFDIRY